jgi:hypothetical protein
MSDLESFIIGKYSLKKIDWDFTEEPLGMLLIWEGPMSGFRYVIGVDSAEGLGEDRCAIEVNRVGTSLRTDEQVAEWCGNVNGIELAPILYTVANLYTVGGEEPMLAIEVNRGDVVQMEMRLRYDWSYFYQQRYYDKVKGGWSHRLGWNTNNDSRTKMLSRAIQQIKSHQWRINSPWLIDELSDFEYNAERMKMKAAVHCHDDRAISSFIALYCSGEIGTIDPEDVANIAKEDSLGKLQKRSFQQMDISADEADNYGNSMLYY